MEYGYIPDEHSDSDWEFLGSTGLMDYGPQLVVDGQWDRLLPKSEIQAKNGVETFSCVTYSLLNCIEAILKAKYGIEYNYSERYVSVLAGTTKQGNSPRTVAGTVRSDGLIPDNELPFDNSIETFDDFMSPKPMEAKYLIEGAGWLRKYILSYEKVNTDTPADMMQALMYSPLQVAVHAWQQDESGLYTATRADTPNHATVVYGYEIGKYWKVFDSYNNTHKRLIWNYPWTQVLRFHIEENTNPSTSWFRELFINFFRLIGLAK